MAASGWASGSLARSSRPTEARSGSRALPARGLRSPWSCRWSRPPMWWRRRWRRPPRSETMPCTHEGAGWILVVEDDAEIRESLRDILEAEGYQVVDARHG